VRNLLLAREPVELAVLVNGSLAAFQSNADAAGVTLVEEVTEDIPLVDADAARLRGVFGNLLSNALCHTPAGGSIVVAAKRSGDQVLVTVRDTGEGIPADLLPRVFDRFVKGPGSRGSGLGLAIARDVVTAHGGTIEVESEVGSGTAVRFRLPIAKDNHDPSTDASPR
jgi:two-component system sensor histidine kinase BaeS